MSIFTTAEERQKEQSCVKGLLVAQHGMGKTFQLRYFNPNDTILIDLESGSLSLNNPVIDRNTGHQLNAWGGNSMDVESIARGENTDQWQVCKDIAVWLSGADPMRADGDYSQAHYNSVVAKWGEASVTLPDVKTIFIDSLTEVGRKAMDWAAKQPSSFNKQGKADGLAMYGLLGKELVTWASRIQKIKGKNVWVSCIMEEKKNDAGIPCFGMQLDGTKAGNEIPCIFDEVIYYANVMDKEHKLTPCFITSPHNQFGYAAKDRSSVLQMFEKPNLKTIQDKILGVIAPTTQQ